MDSFWVVVGNESGSTGPLRSIKLSEYLANVGACMHAHAQSRADRNAATREAARLSPARLRLL